MVKVKGIREENERAFYYIVHVFMNTQTVKDIRNVFLEKINYWFLPLLLLKPGTYVELFVTLKP